MKKQKTQPQVILRKTHFFWEKRGRCYPVPELLLLANKKGFLWLSRFFAACAKKNPDPQLWRNDSDPDDHTHLMVSAPPFDSKRSDEMEIRVGIITPKNRTQVFRKYRIASSRPHKGDLRKQYHDQMREVMLQWKQLPEEP